MINMSSGQEKGVDMWSFFKNQTVLKTVEDDTRIKSLTFHDQMNKDQLLKHS
jgi:hypothetical protein